MKPRIAFIAPLTLILLAGDLAAAPPPLTAPFNVTPAFAPTAQLTRRQVFGPSAAAALSNGDFVAAWFYLLEGDEGASSNGLQARQMSYQGQGGRLFDIFYNWVDAYGEGAECPAIAATASGSYVLAFLRELQIGAVLMVGHDIVSENENNTDNESVGCPALAAAPDGRFVIAWADYVFTDYRRPSTYRVRAFDASGQPLGPSFSLEAPASNVYDDPPAVGMDRTGRFVAVWRGVSSPGLMARRFAPDGTPVGAPFQIAASYASDPVISMAPEGDFAVAYTKPAPEGKPQALVIRRFAADGSEIGAPVSPRTVAEFRLPKASTDRYGNFVLFWQEKGRTRVQIFNRSRAARGASFDAGPAWTAVALADSGRLLTAWPTGADLRGRIWRGLKEDSYCVYRGNAFLCDAAVNGQEVATAALGLGYPIDIPLLGDIDGDGRVDACTRRGARFLCDTKHDGGIAEVKIPFGLPGEPALLGDVDGDGRADPGIHRGNSFLFDTKHDGGAAEVKIAFGVPGDFSLLGDVDGDGRADVCIFRSGVFACDTAHDGVFAEVKLDLRSVGAVVFSGVPLLGDIDGDGRADACFVRTVPEDGSLLSCGLFNRTGGAPYAIVERPVFLQPGDRPLLGGLVP